MRYFGGIDPGLNGGMAVVDEAGNLERFHKLVFGDDELPSGVAIRKFFGDCVGVAIEIQHIRPMQCGSATTLTNYGYLLGCIDSRHIRVSPVAWQKFIHGKPTKDKDKTAEYCRTLFPGRITNPISDGITDAIAIALWCRSQY